MIATTILLAHCGSKKESSKDQVAEAGPAVPVIVRPVVQKTVPIYAELTAYEYQLAVMVRGYRSPE
jgi:hypothetical protein